MKIRKRAHLDKLAEAGKKSLFPRRPKISVSMSTCGLALGADDVYRKMVAAKEKKGFKLNLGLVGCSGFCGLEPLAVVRIPGRPPLLYPRMTPDRADQLMKDVGGKRIGDLRPLCKVAEKGGPVASDGEVNEIPDRSEVVPFKNQQRLVLENCGLIDPESVAEYVAAGGYDALFRALHEMRPEDVIEEVLQSGIRGRGGAWFSTGMKWQMARKSPAREKFVICNADEGDPGAYKDRTIMEGNPLKLLEGLVLAGYAIGSHQGIIYLREEYPHTFEFLNNVIQIARRYSLLGNNVLGSGFNFGVKIVRGGGSYVCGEETALMDSLEGEVGDPRLRPPFPVEKGLWERPTIVNNVETLANIPAIVRHGGLWFSGIGTEKAKGTKILSVVGRVKYPGLYEVPLGTRLETVVVDMAGGSPAGKTIKAVQVGSPFGSFIPAGRLDVTLDPESLMKIDSMLGSGVVVVLDQESCLVDVLQHLLMFFVEESCGKCVPCREGIFRMREHMLKIYSGEGTMQDLELLTELGETARYFSLCGLGGGAPGPVLNGIKDFRKDFEAHITTGKCPWPER